MIYSEADLTLFISIQQKHEMFPNSTMNKLNLEGTCVCIKNLVI